MKVDWDCWRYNVRVASLAPLVFPCHRGAYSSHYDHAEHGRAATFSRPHDAGAREHQVSGSRRAQEARRPIELPQGTA